MPSDNEPFLQSSKVRQLVKKDSNQRLHIVCSLQIRLPWLLHWWSLKEIWARNLQSVKTRGNTVPPASHVLAAKTVIMDLDLFFCFVVGTKGNAPFRFSLYLLSWKIKLPTQGWAAWSTGGRNRFWTSYSSCSRTVDGPSATLFIPDLHCFFPGPYSFSQDYIFEWVYWLHFYRYFPFHMISPLSFHLVLHLFSNTDLKVMADSSAVPLLQCTVTFPFPTCSRYADFQATYVPNSAMFSTPSRHRFLWTVESSSWNQRWNMDEFYCILIELWMKLT